MQSSPPGARENEAIEYASPVYAASEYHQQQDDSHIRTLAICHFVWGGLMAVLSLIPLIHVGLGLAIASGSMGGGTNPPPTWFGLLFAGFGLVAILIGETVAVLNIVSGRRMLQRRSRTLSLVVAGINCLSVPLGTTLGGFTFIVLTRESVRGQYARSEA
jgi:hypothetical protein